MIVASLWTDIQDRIRDFVDGAEEHLASFSVGDWILLGIAAVGVVWVVASILSLTRLGPVEVKDLEHDGDDDDDTPVKALTAALREQLAHNGLIPPPEVPTGTPQADLIAAVEASGAPQSEFLAALLKLVPKPPRPPSYTVSGVLLGSAAPDYGLSFWVRPDSGGSSLVETVNSCPNHATAVRNAAAKIYLHVSNNASGAFPLWARWCREDSLERYVEGCRLRGAGDYVGAIAKLRSAQAMEPFNALVSLQLANIFEALVPDDPLEERAAVQAGALRAYLEVASEWPQLVEARYRASIVAGALASSFEDLSGEQDRTKVCEQLGLPGADAGNFSKRLRDVAAGESKAGLQLLRPWFVLLHDQRLRTQYEPKGDERRELKHTIVISKHCVRVRRISGRKNWRTRIEIRYRSLAVWFRHAVFGRGSLSWQAHYNASCFNAILLRHLRKVAGP
jgi:hypothetical protein